MPKYPHIHVQLTGEDGNALYIIDKVSRALRKAGLAEEEARAFRQEALSGDFDNVLATAMRWVDVS